MSMPRPSFMAIPRLWWECGRRPLALDTDLFIIQTLHKMARGKAAILGNSLCILEEVVRERAGVIYYFSRGVFVVRCKSVSKYCFSSHLLTTLPAFNATYFRRAKGCKGRFTVKVKFKGRSRSRSRAGRGQGQVKVKFVFLSSFLFSTLPCLLFLSFAFRGTYFSYE